MQNVNVDQVSETEQDSDLTIDSQVFESMQKKIVDEKRAEIADITRAIDNIQFSKKQLDIQYTEKKRMLDNRLAELNRVESMTLGSLIENKTVEEKKIESV